MTTPDHREDFHAWSLHNAALLRQGRLQDADAANIAAELEDLAAGKERELENHLGILLAHVLKWIYQPERRSNAWRATIKEQRRRIARLLRRNPSLNAVWEEAFAEAYGDARLIAMRETGVDERLFPEHSPFPPQQALADDYWPQP